MTKRLAGQKILIAGGASTIGRAVTLRCAQEGAALCIVGRRKDVLDEIAAQTGAHAIVADLSREEGASAATAASAKAMGGIDGVVNCVGGSDSASLAQLGRAQWDESFLINVTIPYMVCRAALPFLRESAQASIVNIGSISGLLPGVNSAAYGASKAALIQFTKMIAAQLAPAIRVNCVSPGAAFTPHTEEIILSKRTEEERQAFYNRYASKRLAKPEEIANVILFLLSQEASYVTGSNYVVDGGRAYH